MNTTQIRYFLVAAKCLNFTEAAQKLYISQPALSKQLHAIEEELNMILFLRNGKKVSLTPAGVVLYKELQGFEDNYFKVIQKAKSANEGNVGELHIGILQGQMVGEKFSDAYAAFSEKHPNISIFLYRDTFSGIRSRLGDGTLDIGITLGFDIDDKEKYYIEKIATSSSVFAVSRKHPLSKKEAKDWEDLKDEHFILIEERDSYAGSRMLIADCKKRGFYPNVRYVPSLETVMLCVEAGLGVGIVNTMNYLTLNPSIIILDQIKLTDTDTIMVWKKKNMNPVVPLFNNIFLNNQL
ncbi:MAG: LysR family transcriptional regulator [Herbinix sp.]|jgi:DNA-binding transcriptional LysR family regulator|nr:LysR family transcriptional regulator [Herbinix sp.]